MLAVACLLSYAVAEDTGNSPEPAPKFPSAFELTTMEEDGRRFTLGRICAEAGPSDMPLLLEIAETPEIFAADYGLFALTLARLATPENIPKGQALAKHANPPSRYVGLALVRAPGGDESRRALIGLLDSEHADVRAGATWALRHHPGTDTDTVLLTLARKGISASERSCARAALDWRDAAKPQPARPPRRTVTLASAPVRDLAEAKDIGLVVVPAGFTALAAPECASAVLQCLRNGTTLHIVCGPGDVPQDAARILKEAGLNVPAVKTGPERAFFCHWEEIHPLYDCVMDLCPARLDAPAGDAEASGWLAAEMSRWLIPTSMAFENWDTKEWAAPLRALGDPRRALILEAPPAEGRGRVVLTVGDGRLRLWELESNFRAFLEGPVPMQPVRLPPRDGQPALRSYFDVDESVVTPHVPWAKPLAGGPIPAALLVSDTMVRTAIEIRQRIELDAVYLPFSLHSFGPYGDEKRRGPPVMDANTTSVLRRYLGTAHGVLVIPGLEVHHPDYEYVYAWNGFSLELRVELLQAVRRGLGLVVLGESFPQPIGTPGVAPASCAGFSAVPIETPPSLLGSLPLPASESWRVRCYRAGRGRVVHIGWNAPLGRTDFSLGKDFLVPGLKVPHARVRQDEYLFALCAAAIHWAAGRSFTTEGATKEVHVVDRFGIRRDAGSALTGPSVEEVRWLDEANRVTGWSARRIGPPQSRSPKVALSRRLLSPGDPLQATITWEASAEGDTAECEVTDLHGRVVRRRSEPFPRGQAGVTIPGWRPLGRCHDLRVTVRRKAETVADEVVPFAVETAPHPQDLQLWVWGGATYLFPGFRIAGVTGLTPEAHSAPEASGTDMEQKEATQWVAWEHTLRHGFEVHGGTRFTAGECSLTNDGTRVPCLSDPSFWGVLRSDLAKHGADYRLFGMRWAFTQDEFGLGNKYCTGPCCMAAFRRELSRQYGTLDKLNAAWGTAFKSWNDVLPDDLNAAVQRKNLVSWSQHRAFMDGRVARWQGLSQSLLREHVPGAGMGLSSYTGSSPDGGFDSSKLAQASSLIVRAGGWDYHDLRDLGRPDLVFSHWFSAGYDQRRQSSLVALIETNYDLLEQAGSVYYWYGYGGFQYPFIRPDLQVCEMLQPMVEEIRILRAGIDRLILGAKRRDTDFAVLFSQPSLRTIHGVNRLLGGECQIRMDWAQDVRLLEPAFIRGHLVSPEDLWLGRLEKDRTRLLILSGAVALSMEQVEAIEQFVSAGGCLVADVLPGAFTELSAPQDPSRLARLFGVASVFEPLKDVPSQEVKADDAFGPLAGSLLPVRPCIPGLQVADGVAHGTVGMSAALVTRSHGKGKTLLTNYALRDVLAVPAKALAPEQERATRMRRAAARCLADWAGIASPIEVYRRKDPGAPYDGGDVTTYTDGSALIVGILNRNEMPQAVTIALPAEKVIYDVRARRRIDRCREFDVDLLPGRASYLVLCDEPFPALQAEARVGPDGDVHLALEGGGGRRIAVVNVTDASGRERPELQQKVAFSGRADIIVPLAVNDPPGAWSFRAQDAVTGQESQLRVEVKP